MISFSCSCGKKYQLPDRVAGREVRCNQCEKTLLVPGQSQTEPVVPLDDEEKSIPEHVEMPVDKTPESVPDELQPEEPSTRRLPIFPVVLIVALFVFGVLIGRISAPAVSKTPEIVPPVTSDPTAAPDGPALQIASPNISDWKVTADGVPDSFGAQTADGKAARISPDGNPVEADKKGDAREDVLNAISALDANAPKHETSFRIDSTGSQPVRLFWPGNAPLDLDAGSIREFRLSLYVSEKANAVFNPKNPNGIDKPLELESLALRLIADSGYIEYTPVDRDAFRSIAEHARRDWVSLRIPIGGDATWKRTEHGLFGPSSIHRVEWIVRPTGTGIAFWIEKLEMVTSD